jgi:hypothetical protein
MEIVPVRSAPVFAATLNVTTPFPLPGDADMIEIHDALLVAPHSHRLWPCTSMEPAPPVAGKL